MIYEYGVLEYGQVLEFTAATLSVAGELVTNCNDVNSLDLEILKEEHGKVWELTRAPDWYRVSQKNCA